MLNYTPLICTSRTQRLWIILQYNALYVCNDHDAPQNSILRSAHYPLNMYYYTIYCRWDIINYQTLHHIFNQIHHNSICKYRICRNKPPPKTVIFQRGEYTKPMGFVRWFFKGESTQNRWILMGDFSKGEYTKPMAFDGWFFKGGSTQNRWILMGDFSKGGVHKTDGLWWGLECFFIASRN